MRRKSDGAYARFRWGRPTRESAYLLAAPALPPYSFRGAGNSERPLPRNRASTATSRVRARGPTPTLNRRCAPHRCRLASGGRNVTLPQDAHELARAVLTPDAVLPIDTPQELTPEALAELAGTVRHCEQAAWRIHAQVGHLLREVKQRLGRQQFLAFLKDCGLSEHSADRRMQLAVMLTSSPGLGNVRLEAEAAYLLAQATTPLRLRAAVERGELAGTHQAVKHALAGHAHRRPRPNRGPAQASAPIAAANTPTLADQLAQLSAAETLSHVRDLQRRLPPEALAFNIGQALQHLEAGSQPAPSAVVTPAMIGGLRERLREWNDPVRKRQNAIAGWCLGMKPAAAGLRALDIADGPAAAEACVKRLPPAELAPLAETFSFVSAATGAIAMALLAYVSAGESRPADAAEQLVDRNGATVERIEMAE